MGKYPWVESDPRAEEGDPRKFGVYDNPEDLEYFEWLWDGKPPARSVATDILEAADDLAYAVHDIEDGIWARLIPIDQIVQQEKWTVRSIVNLLDRRTPGLFSSLDDVAEELGAIFGELRDQTWAQGPFDRARASEGGLKSFCSKLTNDLITAVTNGGSLHWRGNNPLQRRIAVLKAIIWVWMIEQPELVTRRYGQRRVISDLFDGFLDEPGMLPYADEWARVADQGIAAQARLVSDHIAAMTDTAASWTHAEMFGHSRGSGWE
jgi:dGTPase